MMGQTIVEKIFSNHLGKNVVANEFVLLEPDFMISHEGLGPIAIQILRDFGIDNVKYPEKMGFIIDHSGPSLVAEYSRRHQIVRDFANERNIVLYEIGEGIIHRVFAEKGHFKPGDVVIGGDSHTCTAGALNLFATGIGATDLAVAFGSGKMWYRVPSSMKITLNGAFKKGVAAKDLILHLIKLLGVRGATYKCMEFDGELLEHLDMDARITISNMAVEMGAKAGIFKGDEITKQWFAQRGITDVNFVSPDPDAVYANKLEIDAGSIEPTVSGPHVLDSGEPVGKFSDVEISMGLLGTCTNGHLEDLRVAAGILKGKKIKSNVTLLVVPASRQILIEATREGLIDTLIRAGAVLMPPGCGPCSSKNPGVPGDGHSVISSSSRNYPGRMGNPNSAIYIGSPATVAASVITGHITDPREFIQ